jgi:site-specific DNA recombinase
MMQSTNGHAPRNAILYACVSADEQARSGYSLAQQLEVLRKYAAREGYEVLEEITDPGQSGASLERPGMDRVRDLVAAGSVLVVLAQDRDRFAREPAYHYLLRREFEEHGCKLKALNDRGDDSPEGELTDGILDQLAKYERAKTAERTRRGKLRRVREGKILPVRRVRYGFKLNAARDGYVVDEAKMPVVRRIFSMVEEGATLYGVVQTLNREGVEPPEPSRSGLWSITCVRGMIKDDVYRPHSFEEVGTLIAPEVVARLDPSVSYGLWWFNRKRTVRQQVAEYGPEGRIYRNKIKAIQKPSSEWIAVPVPDSGLPREVVDRARAAIRDNRPTSGSKRRFWELSGGLMRCGGCGRRMTSTSITPGNGCNKRYFYYRCTKPVEGSMACPGPKTVSA